MRWALVVSERKQRFLIRNFEFIAKHIKDNSYESEQQAQEVCFRARNFSKRSDLLFSCEIKP